MARNRTEYPKNEALTEVEINELVKVDKEKNIAYARSSKVREKMENDEYKQVLISNLVDFGTEQLKASSASEKVSLSDVESVRNKAYEYLEACSNNSVLPNFLGLATCLGYTRRALYYCIEKRNYPETADFLEFFKDTCSDLLSQSALYGAVNQVYAIFLNKSIHGLQDTVSIDFNDKNKQFEDTRTLEEIVADLKESLPPINTDFVDDYEEDYN